MLVAATLSTVVAICTGAASLGAAAVGLLFRGAAQAWKEERDAAIEKADRLEATVRDQAHQIGQLQTRIAALEKQTNFEAYKERTSREHKQIIDTLNELGRSLNASTTALEFLAKQIFPTAVTPIQLPEGGQ